MGVFAHTADIHLGFQKYEGLQLIEQRAFESMLDRCIEKKVDFILVAGDLFHTNIPEMRVQKYAFAAFRRVREAGIPVYAVYGSHDASPVHNSVIDLLEAAGYITKVSKGEEVGGAGAEAAAEAGGAEAAAEAGGAGAEAGAGKIRLSFTTDPATGIKIAGIPGLKAGRDEAYYRMLDREALAAEPGLKIFMFHGGFSEIKTGRGHEGEFMPISMLPAGFDYYAGGHMHRHLQENHEGVPVVYPGTPFAGYHGDLEENAGGVSRGFVMVEFDGGKVLRITRDTDGPPVEYLTVRVDAQDRTAESVASELAEKVRKADPSDKVVLVRVGGELTVGRTADVDLNGAVDSLDSRGAKAVSLNRSSLTSKEYRITASQYTGTRREVERAVFSENVGEVRAARDELRGEKGIALAVGMLDILRQEQPDGENKEDYVTRVLADAAAAMLAAAGGGNGTEAAAGGGNGTEAAAGGGNGTEAAAGGGNGTEAAEE